MNEQSASTSKRLSPGVLVFFAAASLILAPAVTPEAQAKPKPKAAAAKRGADNGSGRDSRGGGDIDMSRSKNMLPTSQKLVTPEAKPRDLTAVKPPSSSELYGEDPREQKYERLLDEEIKKLYQLANQYKRSRSRGEIWLRLAEAYVEKARMLEFREQAEYEKKLKDFVDKKTRIKPKVNLDVARDYNKKAIQLYEYFMRDFPQDKKIDQALFFLGYNYFESGDVKTGESYYQRLIKEYPNSVYVVESYFALGEYYFENDEWEKALEHYQKVIQRKKARLNTFAMYKASWCLYRTNRVGTALKMLERVVKLSRGGETPESNVEGRKSINKVRLASEALKDYVPFYAEVGEYKDAPSEFARVAQSESLTFKMLERLAYIYADSGNRVAANAIFKELIAQNPTGESAADYQYQVILAYATADQKRLREEMVVWVENFGADSAWAKANAGKPKVAEVLAKQEVTLRNHVLQLHKTAQDSRAEYSQQQANSGYGLYMKFFSEHANAAEMQFFHGELLFDMARHQEAAKVYLWSAEKDPKGKYAGQAITNAVLALEKELPQEAKIKEKRGDSNEPVPLDPEVQRFEFAAKKYFEAFPKGDKTSDVKRRLGVLYYSYNQFDKAIAIFEEIIRNDPKSANAEVAGHLMLDVYKLKGDMEGLAKKGGELLSNPAIASTKFGTEVKGMMEQATYVRAQKLSDANDHGASAKEFEKFATLYPGSALATAARYNAGVNFEKAGEIGSALRMHGLVISSNGSDPKTKQMQNDARNALARLYQQTGQLEMAAKQYESFANANPKDQKAINGYFNAALIWDGMGNYGAATRNYDAYMAKSSRGDRFESLFLEAEMARKRGMDSKAIVLYDQYLQRSARNKENVVKSHFQIAALSQKLGRVTKAREAYTKTIGTYNYFKKSGAPVGVQYAAEARFILSQDVITQLRGIRFTANVNQQGAAAKQIKQLRERYINEMKDVIRFDYGPMIVAALASSGQMYDYIAYSLSRVPVPTGFNEEEGKQYKGLLQQEIDKNRNDAKATYKAAWDKALEFESYGEWSKVASQGLSQHDPEFQDAGELAAKSAAVDWMGL